LELLSEQHLAQKNDRDDEDFQYSFYGSSYDQILQTKKAVDPEQVF
jgi:Berberine and berberine like